MYRFCSLDLCQHLVLQDYMPIPFQLHFGISGCHFFLIPFALLVSSFQSHSIPSVWKFGVILESYQLRSCHSTTLVSILTHRDNKYSRAGLMCINAALGIKITRLASLIFNRMHFPVRISQYKATSTISTCNKCLHILCASSKKEKKKKKNIAEQRCASRTTPYRMSTTEPNLQWRCPEVSLFLTCKTSPAELCNRSCESCLQQWDLLFRLCRVVRKVPTNSDLLASNC